jgi:hypothetical protein
VTAVLLGLGNMATSNDCTVERLCLLAITAAKYPHCIKNLMKMCLCDYFVVSSWKDPKCLFRTDKRLRLKSVPAFMVWGQPEKVEDTEYSNPDLV